MGPLLRRTDTTTLAQINAHAVEHDHFAVTDEGIAELLPGGSHIGVAFYFWQPDGFTPVRRQEAPQDGWAWVVWAAEVSRGLMTVHIVTRVSAFRALPEARLDNEDEVIAALDVQGRDYAKRLFGSGTPRPSTG